MRKATRSPGAILAVAACAGALLVACSDGASGDTGAGGQPPGAGVDASASAGASTGASADLAAAPQIAASALAEMRLLGEEKRARTPAQRKLGSQLLMEAKRRRGDPLFRALPAYRPGLRVSPTGTAVVDVAGDVGPALLAHVRALGGTVVSSLPAFGALQAELPIDRLEELAEDPAVRSIRPNLGFVTNKTNTSQGDAAHRAATVRSTRGITGAGVNIAVISDGATTVAARQATGDLPQGAQLRILPGQAGTGDEGTAMMEIVTDLAPGANLLFATAGTSPAQMAQNILDLRTAGANIIVDDIAYLTESAFQDDVIARAVNQVTAGGALYFSAAGNFGNLDSNTAGLYEGDYLPATPPAVVPAAMWPDVHNFGGGAKADVITADPPTFITLMWSDPSGKSTNDYDLFLMNAALTAVIDSSTMFQTGNTDPLEFIDSSAANHAGAALVVARTPGAATRYLRLNTLGGRLATSTNGQVWGHAATDNAFAIAAVNVATAGGAAFVGGAINPVETFSSDGPRRMFYNPDGTAITAGNFLSTGGLLRQKPDFAAANRVATATPGFNPFAGTSAAAPHAAAIAGLLLSARPDIAVFGDVRATNTARTVLASGALDIQAAGRDNDSGLGIVMATPITTVCSALNPGAPCDDGNPCTTSDTCVSGACVGSPTVTCAASDQCHVAGVCNPTTGLCSNPNKTDGSTCNDGSACTLGDVCRAGACVGSAPVVCAASDQCHAAGVCNPTTGLCSNPAKADGTACSDGNACTTLDACRAGACAGGSSVFCGASDQCHDPGTCNPATGLCSNPAKSDGTACSDGNACTRADTCQAGACVGLDPVVCAASGECRGTGPCDPGTGQCPAPPAADGTPCSLGACSSGVCTPRDAGSGGAGGGGAGGAGGARDAGATGDASDGGDARDGGGGSAGGAGGSAADAAADHGTSVTGAGGAGGGAGSGGQAGADAGADTRADATASADAGAATDAGRATDADTHGDAGASADATSDAGPPVNAAKSGCGCDVNAGAGGHSTLALAGVAALLAARRRKRAAARSPRA